MSTVMGSQGRLLGTGRLEISPLLSGGVHLVDTWVELEVGIIAQLATPESMAVKTSTYE